MKQDWLIGAAGATAGIREEGKSSVRWLPERRKYGDIPKEYYKMRMPGILIFYYLVLQRFYDTLVLLIWVIFLIANAHE